MGIERPRGTQADGRGSDVQDAGFEHALEPVAAIPIRDSHEV